MTPVKASLVSAMALGAALAISAIATSAYATNFLFTYTSNDGSEAASGTLSATANGDGTYTALNGVINALGPVAAGAGSLMANPAPPAASYSPSGYFIYDDQLLPGQNPLITNNGLLFDIGGAEINIFSNGPGPDTYQFYSNNGANDFGNFALTQASVPEPGAWALMLLGVGLAGATLRMSPRQATAKTRAASNV
jgi:hypothetical protein